MRLLASIAIASVVAGSGCQWAVKHPSATAGIVVGSIGFATCSLTTSIGDEDTSFVESGRAKCYGIAAGAGLAIALITVLAQWIGYEDADPAAPNSQGGTIEDPANLEPAPVFVPKVDPKPPKSEAPNPEPEPKPEPPAEPPAEPPIPPVAPPPVP